MDEDDQLKRIIRNLATNVYMPDLDYGQYELVFNTVFYRTSYSYRCCRCAYVHEYLEYIRDDWGIDEPLYEEMVANVIYGECKHAKGTPKEYLKETGLYGIHFASACGTIETLRRQCVQNLAYFFTKLFRANLWTIAVAKHNDLSLQVFIDTAQNELIYRNSMNAYVTKSERGEKVLNIRDLALLEQCVVERSIPLVKRLLDSYTGVPAGLLACLRIIFEYDLLDLQDIFLDFIRKCSERGTLIHTISCAALAVVYKKTAVFEKILKTIPQNKCNLDFWLRQTCDALQQNGCQRILNQLTSSTTSNNYMHVDQRMTKFLELLVDYHDVEKDKIIAAFKADKESYSLFLKRYSGSMSFAKIFMGTRHTRMNPHFVRALYDLGLDINAVDSSNRTALEYFLNGITINCLQDRRVWETLSVLIQENPNFELNKNVVRLGVKLDIMLARKSFKTLKMKGEYVCDGVEHFLYDENKLALNFMGPYLIESGFRTKAPIYNYEEEQILHPEGLAYLKRYFDTPRSLMLRCRDVLRQRFPGRTLHSYLDKQQVPRRIKDFVLIKT